MAALPNPTTPTRSAIYAVYEATRGDGFREHLGAAGWLGVAGVVCAGALVSGIFGWPGVWAGVLVAAACLCWGLDNQLTALVDGVTPARSTLVKGAVAGSVNLAIGAALAQIGRAHV